jgi:hypothetical protein
MTEKTTISPNLEKIGKLVLAVVLVTAVLLGLQTAIVNLDVNTMPSGVQQFFAVLKTFFAGGLPVLSPLGLFVLSLLRNQWGYITEWVKSKYKESFEFQKFWTTVAYYVGLLGTFLAIAVTLQIPDTWRNFGTFLIVIVDLLKQAFNTLGITATSVKAIFSD